ncbi:uncharacterized protein LOC109837157 isoform X1 [Asparagus officinalis]|uniref:uncharacterized protein LOC109837157 isoform X1 n=1 Tax=Asparagus officinalis TaxID=4686 RepID=UPI00098E7050|nr:uncharacterized protein LOC109837157 isoform X1 [Asparagus officinalis]
MKAAKKSAVLYHYPCPDGAFAALAAYLYFKAASLPVAFFPNTVYDPIKAGNLPVDELSDVYLLDFVGPSGFVAEISTKVESVTILDHHKTAFEALSGNSSIGSNVTKIIDMKRSGATIAYDYFREKLFGKTDVSRVGDSAGIGVNFVPDSDLERVNRLFKFIEDADLWRWALPLSKAFNSGLKDMNIEYNVNLNKALFDQLFALDPEYIISHGQNTLLHKQELIEKVLEQSYEIVLGSGRFGHCLAVDADSISNLRSELGDQLANKSRNLKLRVLFVCVDALMYPSMQGIGAVVYKVPEINNDRILKISLRSLDSEDTTPISQEYGGGGHRTASSFMLDTQEFERWKVGGEPQC